MQEPDETLTDHHLGQISSTDPFPSLPEDRRPPEDDDEDDDDEEDSRQKSNEDEPFSSKRELLSWICYDWASTVFPGVANAVFIPLLLEQLAYNQGRIPGTDNTPCGSIVYAPPSGNTTQVLPDANLSTACEVYFGPIGFVPTVSYVLYISTISIIFQTLTYMSLGALADYGRWRKSMMMFFAISGSLLAIAFTSVTNSGLYWLASVLTILCTVCYGTTIIFYNAYLSVLVQNHPIVRGRIEEMVDLEGLKDQLTLLGVSKKVGQWKAQAQVMMTSTSSALKRKAKKLYQRAGISSSSSQEPVIPEIRIDECQSPIQSSHFAGSISNSNDAMPPTQERTLPRPPSYSTLDFSSNSPSILQLSPERPQDQLSVTADTSSSLSEFTRSRVAFQTKLQDQLANTLSTHGIASGQLATLLVFLLSIPIIYTRPQDGFDGAYSMIIIVALVGLWWFLFSMVTWYYLKPRPGPPLPKKAGNFLLFSWRKSMSRLFIDEYLLAYFIQANALTTVGRLAILFAKKTINMTNSQISVALVIGPIAALFGGYFWLWISRRFLISTRRMLIILLSTVCLLPLYGLLGYIKNTGELTIISGTGPNNIGALTIGFGLKTVMEMYIAVCFFASLLGSIQSFSRVLYTDVLPKKHEAEFFTLSEICIWGTSWIGPLAVGAIANATGGDLRPAFVFILAMFSVPIVILYKWVDVTKGRRECEIFVTEEEAKMERKLARREQRRLRQEAEQIATALAAFSLTGLSFVTPDQQGEEQVIEMEVVT